MNLLALLSLASSIGMLLLGQNVYLRNRKNTLNRAFLLLASILSLWAFFEFIFRNTANPRLAFIFIKLHLFLGPLIGPFYLLFALRFADKTDRLKRKSTYTLIFGPPLAVSWLTLLTNMFDKSPIRTVYGFSFGLPANPLLLFAAIAWTDILVLVGIVVIWRGAVRSPYKRKLKQAGYIILGTVLPAAGGIATTLIAPLLGSPAPNLTSVFFTITVALFAYAITRYELFSINPAQIAENIVSTMSEAIIVFDPQGMVLDINAAAKQMLGLKARDIIGNNLDRFLRNKEILGSLLPKRDRTPTNIKSVETQLVSPVKGKIDVLFSSSIVFSRGTEVAGIVGVARDITDRKVAEEALRQAKDKLEIKVEERTAELKESNVSLKKEIDERKKTESALARQAKELAESNAELEQFAYVASHDLQEPLRMVSSYVRLLAKRYQGKLDKDADDFINFAADGAVRMKALIDDLLAYSRVTTRGKPPQSVDSGEILNQALLNLKIAIDENGAIVTAGDLPTVKVDSSQLLQLFQNLISNAIKFRREETPRIRISAEPKQNQWVFCVKDNGIGIEPRFQNRIFAVFQRLQTRADYPGTGIGLALCKKIVERHGGNIWVKSQPGAGSAFYFTLPGDRA